MDTKNTATRNLTLDTRTHGFNVGIARDFSPTMALWIGYLGFWSEQNLANDKNIYDGLVWSYNKLEALGDIFPYFTKRQIETMINNSIKAGLVVKGNYNKTKYDRTCWYALTPEAYYYFPHLVTKKYMDRLFLSISPNCEIDFAQMCNRFPQIVTPIPDTEPDTKPDAVGEAPQHTQDHSFSSKTQNQVDVEKKAYGREDLKKLFDEKFAGYAITYDYLFEACKEHYEQKRQWVTVNKWKSWIIREKLDNHRKIESNVKNNLTDEEKKIRQLALEYNEYAQRIKQDKFLKIIPEDTQVMDFKTWRLKNKK